MVYHFVLSSLSVEFEFSRSFILFLFPESQNNTCDTEKHEEMRLLQAQVKNILHADRVKAQKQKNTHQDERNALQLSSHFSAFTIIAGRLIPQAVQRGGDAAAAGDELLRRALMEGHDGGAAQKAAEVDPVAHGLAPGGDQAGGTRRSAQANWFFRLSRLCFMAPARMEMPSPTIIYLNDIRVSAYLSQERETEIR